MSVSVSVSESQQEVNQFWEVFHQDIVQVEKAVTLKDIVMAKLYFKQLQRSATYGSRILPLYDVKRVHEESEKCYTTVRKLQNSLTTCAQFVFQHRDQFIVTKEFLAEKSSNESDVSYQSSSTSVTTTTLSALLNDESQTPVNDLTDNSHRIMHQQNARLIIGMENGCFPSSSRKLDSATQYIVAHCDTVTIDIPRLIGNVIINNVHKSTLFLGPCGSSVAIDDCSDCCFYILTHQLRIHRCTNCQFYVLCVATVVVVEDVQNVSFGKNLLQYQKSRDDSWKHDLKESGLEAANKWRGVVDFRWHKSASASSPHFHIMTKQQQQQQRQHVLLEKATDLWCYRTDITIDDNSEDLPTKPAADAIVAENSQEIESQCKPEKQHQRQQRQSTTVLQNQSTEPSVKFAATIVTAAKLDVVALSVAADEDEIGVVGSCCSL